MELALCSWLRAAQGPSHIQLCPVPQLLCASWFRLFPRLLPMAQSGEPHPLPWSPCSGPLLLHTSHIHMHTLSRTGGFTQICGTSGMHGLF